MVVSLGRWLVIPAAVILLLSCGMMARPGQEFETVSRDYAQRLRWMDFNGASRHHTEEFREAFLRQIGDLRDLKIVDVRLETVELREKARGADTSIVLEYYLLPSATVRQFRLKQEWAYLGGDRYRPGAWRIVSPFPGFP